MSILKRRCCFSIFAILLPLLLLVACNGGQGEPSAQTTATATATGASAQRLLQQSEQQLTAAQTLHTLVTIAIDGETYQGTLTSEIWKASAGRSRSQILRSTLSDFPAGELTVCDGQRLWIYHPTRHIVYSGSLSGQGGSAIFGSSSNPVNQLTLNLIDPVFRQSRATLASQEATVAGHTAIVIHVTSQQVANAGPDYSGDVYLDRRSDLPLKLVLNLQGFAQVTLQLSTLELNRPLSDSLFRFTPPADVQVVPLLQASATPTSGTLTLGQAEQLAGYHLLSLPSSQSAYQLEGVDVLTSTSGQVFVLHYLKGDQSFSILEGQALANEPLPSGIRLTLRGTTATYSTDSDNPTLAWKEQGLGIRISGDLDEQEAIAIANLLS
ncbi:outer membrane lipoprotein carrier protein LolA [Thermogemmatispora sp.]|uniref:LolA family protein n=1 Tax=Thermogemmatispora sp. TaxID=1968838 RepID=UPI0035E4032C